MGHQITLLSPAYSEEDHTDDSLAPYCDEILLFDSPGRRSMEEIEVLQGELKRPPFFLSGDGGYDPKLDEAFRALLAENTYDAIIAEYSMMGQYLEGAKALIPPETVTIISVHECYTSAFRQRMSKGEDIEEELIQELYEYEFEMYRSVNLVLSLTHEDMQVLLELEPDLEGKTRVIPHGVDTDFYTLPSMNSWDSRNILYLGNFRHYPNVDAVHNFLKNSWGRISNEVPDATFSAIGFDPPPELTSLRSDRITVKTGGEHSDVRNTYWESDIFVAPIELGGGFRGKMLEALACGLPIVSTHLAAFGIDPVNGEEMFVTDDYDEFTEIVIRLLTDIDLRKKVGIRARALGVQFDHKNAARKLNDVIEAHRTT